MTQLKVIIGGHTPGAQKTFIELFEDFNQQDATECGFSERTLYKYNKFAENFAQYLTSTGQGDSLPEHITMHTLKYFVLWLPENLVSCNRTHISKHIARIQKALTYCVELGYMPHNACAGYHVKRAKNKPVISLDDSEFLTWVNAKWKSKIYQDAQDCYIFQMTTGLAYGDLFNYATTESPEGVWIEGTRSKTGRPYYIPLFHVDFELARTIHEKHGGQLPRLENDFYNRVIREMASVLGIDKYLNTHLGRKTFATRKNDSGYGIPAISAMLGNTEKVCETHYIGISKKKILAELKRRA